MKWEVPRQFEGRTVFILGGGPSLQDVDLGLFRGRAVIGTNDAYRLGDFVGVCFFGDFHWLATRREDGKTHRAALFAFPGLVVTTYGDASVFETTPYVRVLARRPNFQTDRSRCGWFANTGTSAVNLAYLMGARRVVLVAFDMKLRDGSANWHINLKDRPNPEIYARFISHFERLERERLAAGAAFEIVNATPGSALTLYPFVDLAEEVARDE